MPHEPSSISSGKRRPAPPSEARARSHWRGQRPPSTGSASTSPHPRMLSVKICPTACALACRHLSAGQTHCIIPTPHFRDRRKNCGSSSRTQKNPHSLYCRPPCLLPSHSAGKIPCPAHWVSALPHSAPTSCECPTPSISLTRFRSVPAGSN